MVNIYWISECPAVSSHLWGPSHGRETRKIEPKVREGCWEAVFWTWQSQYTHILSEAVVACTTLAHNQASQHSTLNKVGAHKVHLSLRSYWYLVVLRKGESVFFRGILIFPVDVPTCIHLDNLTQWVLKKRWIWEEHEGTVWNRRRWRGLRNGDDLHCIHVC